MKVILPKDLEKQRKLKEEMEARQRHAKLMEGPQWWWDNWEYSDYRKALKEERKKRLAAEEELARMTKKENLRKGNNIK
tara:strand:+ start:12913 stop:13149 length:237 start_codon:yes stop_codon:yes gene_type:complete